MSFSRRLGFLLALTVLVPTSLSAIVPVAAPPPSLVPVTINAGAGDQFDPHVSGDWVAYTSDFAIRYYNFATDVDAQIPLGGSVHDLLAGISGSKIVFSRVLLGVKTTVMIFDAATPLVAPIEIDPAAATNRFGTAIGGNTVAYIDFALQTNGELVVHDLSTSTSVRLTNDTVVDGNPSVSPDGNVVVWERCPVSLTICDIWQAVRSGAVWIVTATTASSWAEANPETNGTVVVYDAQRTGDMNILWRPTAGGAEVELAFAGYQANPSIAGNIIAFESRATLLDAADIFVYDMTTNRVFQITNTPGVNEQLNDITVLSDGSLRVVWASDEDGFDARNIRAATFQLPYAGTNAPGAMQPPIDPDGSSTFKLGQTIPVRISVTDQSGRPVDGLAPQIALVLIGTGATDVNEVVMSGSADTGTTMRGLGGGAYIFNLSTKRSQFNAGQDLTDGRYRLTITEPTFTVSLVTEFGLRR